MEFDDIGGHCTVKDCRVHDYLPVSCNACRKVFCGEHFSYAAHGCVKGENRRKGLANSTLECTLCLKVVVVRKGEDPDAELARHIARGCGSQKKNQICNVTGCKTREIVPIQCKRCLKQYCFSHRIELDHECSGPPASSSKLWEARQKPKVPAKKASKASANKVLGNQQLAKNQRQNLLVASPLLGDTNTIDMFFNRNFTVGKMMDEATGLIRLGELKEVRLYAFRVTPSGSALPLGRLQKLSECTRQNDIVIIDIAENADLEFVSGLSRLNTRNPKISPRMIRVNS
ncbi:hypothetical protein NDN08_005545 [Rhodosorus marinus]|uniref:AN1-type domain-containing protein n=1 Tax=Rhodosorus marinus TaxID=101924 RepID=A0AAV8V1X7_9RHOD|nr:hypothetical protein NDN08_005545 [Rhodosorus marinus]